nr:TetR/AcrR family transcriptional regulator [Mucilaginibacter sp. L294]
MRRTRDPDDKASRLIDAVGETLIEKGFSGLGVNKIAARAGVSKPMVYRYFGNFAGLLKAYISGKDSWVPYFKSLDLPEQPTTDDLKNCFIKMLQDQFRYFHQEKEMQRLIHWQVSEYNPLMRATCEVREKEGLRLLDMVEGHFRNSGVSLKAVLALLVGGVYFNVLHDSADAGTMAGIDLKTEKQFEVMLNTLAQVIEWAFQAAESAK